MYDGFDVTVTSNITRFHPNHDMVSCRIYKQSIYEEHSITVGRKTGFTTKTRVSATFHYLLYALATRINSCSWISDVTFIRNKTSKQQHNRNSSLLTFVRGHPGYNPGFLIVWDSHLAMMVRRILLVLALRSLPIAVGL